ncbi:SWIM zinc finger family protein [Alicyclobacillus acidocaldarius]|uniref:Zinc finger SWIM domain protein n=1 Tax=Alicyclobacillus acidocaldarius subsp. acidocaldarius (strain ATCC 27009 / DSM 446 / BCRC 14685 / JCM 5260 / KCTC 1825 / NBRC 15652 / NCIMB 11725 / NRRL B-14509 / 104-IA) TaxID=521098 RepID=C8WUV0_ALIAD|nr:SWIM zinc finger family protein [Alicyclobacillus acidocaldarius]ACV57939.1 zinc finger SWIM domain protein [Alicyclobacillus acidocaldarius subsp. acidocaldarius DSM 446]
MHRASGWRKALRELTSPFGWQDVLPEYVFDRGVEYAETGRVVSWSLQDGVIHAVVHGAADYRVFLHVEDVEKSRCSCPYGGPCKHMVAVALRVARETRLDGIRGGQPLDLDACLGSIGDGELPGYVADVMASRPDVSLLVRASRFVHTAPTRWADEASLSRLHQEARALLLAADRIAQGDAAIPFDSDAPPPVTVTYTGAGWESARRLIQTFADALAGATPAALAPYAVYDFRRLVARFGDDVPDDDELHHRALLRSLGAPLATAVKRLSGLGEAAIDAWRAWSLAKLSEATCAEDVLVALAALQGGWLDTRHLRAACERVTALDDFPRPPGLRGCVPHVPWIPLPLATLIEENWREMIAFALQMGDLAAADEIARMRPVLDREADMRLAQAAMDAEDWGIAESSLKRIAGTRPSADVWAMLADVMDCQGKSDGATSCLREAFLCDPTGDRRDRWLARVPDEIRHDAVIQCANLLLNQRHLAAACGLLLHQGRLADAWRALEVGIQGAEMWSPGPGLERVMTEFAAQDAGRLVRLVARVALEAIDLRGRDAYRRACRWLVVLRAGLMDAGRGAAWDEVRAAVEAESRRLPALRDELRASGLLA